MKLKYHINSKIIQYLFIIIILFLFFVNSASAAILTSSATPSSIFKCGESTISATFNDAGVTAVDAYLISTKAVQPMVPGSGRINPETENTTVALAFNGTHWVGTFGQNTNLLWGERYIIFGVTAGGFTTYQDSNKVFVYNSGACTGTGKNSYQNYTTGIGNYTNMIAQTDIDLLTWALYPWVKVFGYAFYVFMLIIVTAVIYIKTEKISVVSLVGLAFLLYIANNITIDEMYKAPIIWLGALVLGGIIYKVMTREY